MYGRVRILLLEVTNVKQVMDTPATRQNAPGRVKPPVDICDGCGNEHGLLYAHTRLTTDGQIVTDAATEHFCSDCVPVYRNSDDAYIQLHTLITDRVRAWAAHAIAHGVDDLEFVAETVVNIGIRQAKEAATMG